MTTLDPITFDETRSFEVTPEERAALASLVASPAWAAAVKVLTFQLRCVLSQLIVTPEEGAAGYYKGLRSAIDLIIMYSKPLEPAEEPDFPSEMGLWPKRQSTGGPL